MSKGAQSSDIATYINETDRDISIKKIVTLCEKKKYKLETLHLAINIFDSVLR